MRLKNREETERDWHEFYKLELEKSRKKLLAQSGELSACVDMIKDLSGKLQFLVNTMDLDEGAFTFPDGETWLKNN